jgi:choline dehydrogenase-like flavoprotein
VHGADNVFVCGSSSFTTGAAAHPTLTVAALAHRLGALLADGSA